MCRPVFFFVQFYSFGQQKSVTHVISESYTQLSASSLFLSLLLWPPLAHLFSLFVQQVIVSVFPHANCTIPLQENKEEVLVF